MFYSKIPYSGTVSGAAFCKITTICQSVTEFSQDWIISFSDIVHDDSWLRYLVTDKARFLGKKTAA